MTVLLVIIGNPLILFLQILMNGGQVNSIPKPLKAIIVPFAIRLALHTSMLVIGVNVRKTEFRLNTFFRTLPYYP